MCPSGGCWVGLVSALSPTSIPLDFLGWHHSRSKEQPGFLPLWPVPRHLEHLVKSSGETAFGGRILLSSPNPWPGLILRCTSQKQPCICLCCFQDQYTDTCYH